MIAEEATKVDFVATKELEQISKEDKHKAALAKLFPHSSFVNLHHLKPLYVMAYIE